jgi:ribulose bisphosphate carboxylase small subunit
MTKIRTLFLAANPKDTTQLAIDDEIREITYKIRLSEGRDVLEVVSAWAVRPDDLLQYLNQYKPQIVHFSGHGNDIGEIILVDNNGDAKPVSKYALKALFTTLKDSIQIVVLNACYSRIQGEAINEAIDYVIGMNTAIGDRAAIIFAASFYRAIGFERSVQEAFDQATTALLLEGIPEENTPELLIKQGVSSHKKIYVATHIVDEKTKELIIDILGNTFRRAFSLNFTTRFVDYEEYKKVLRSIQDCHAFLQQRMVRVVTICNQETVRLVDTMLRQLELMETVFRKMEPYARDPNGLYDELDKSAYFLPGRIDGTGQPSLTRAFVDMEKIRLDFLLNTTKLAEKFEIPLPKVPVTEARPVFHGAITNLELPTVENLEQTREELVNGWLYNIKPTEYPLNE